ncbi:MAG: hypothetical protein KBE65_02635 [Phycisphaerae bacterium]|nr:hypothetical protein [Phycisphaerae bacterium]
MMLFDSSHRSSRVRLGVGLLVLLGGAPLAAWAAQYGGGDGTQQNPFLISTAQEFAAIGENSADWSKYFKLTADIDLSDCNETNLHMIGKWVVVGSAANLPFSGNFEGDGKTISGFRYKDMQSQYVGLFQYVTGNITNLKLTGATVTGNGFGAGALVGYQGRGAVTSCSVTGAKVSGNLGVGALVGALDGSAHMCRSNGAVTGVRYIGGLVGQLGGGRITRSYSKAKVVGSESVGGLIGGVLKQTSVVESCYATGSVSGALYVGGLVGALSSGSVWHSYSTGAVSGTQSAGGLIGQQWALGEVFLSFWDTQTSGQATSAAGTGKTTAEMKSFDMLASANWDFATIWAICDGVGYPVFLWQLPVGDLRCPDGVNFTDFVWFAANWRHDDCSVLNYSCEGADLDGSGEVDPRDLALFAANWLAGLD